MNKKRILAFAACVALSATMISGCGSKKEEAASNGAEVILNGDAVYPVSSTDTLSYYMQLNVQLQGAFENFIDTPLGKELEKKTGIKVEYMHPQSGQEAEQINILMASDDLPDMVQHTWNYYAGGPDSAINEGVIYSLNDYLEDFAPDFKKYLDDNPDVAKKAKTDAGNYYTIPFIRGKEWLSTYQGFILRKDWLDKAGLDVPKTVDEYENVLKAFKEFSTGEPLFLKNTQRAAMMYAYGIGDEFYLDDAGKVQYGPMQPQYKKVLEKMNKWYNEGLLNPDFAVSDSTSYHAGILNGSTGAFYGAVSGGIAKYLGAKPADVPEFDLIAIAQITEDGSDVPEFAYMEDTVNLNVGTAVSKNCKNIELALRYLNYGFTEEGNMLYNFGIEGESYTMENGEPVLTELITNNPEGLTLSQASARYLRAGYNGPFVHDERYVKQSIIYPQQQAAYDKWSNTNMAKHLMPPATLLPEELDASADITANIKTYVDEMYIKFINGSEPLSNFDKYVEQIKAFGIEELLEMKNSSLERYNNR